MKQQRRRQEGNTPDNVSLFRCFPQSAMKSPRGFEQRIGMNQLTFGNGFENGWKGSKGLLI